MFSKYAHVPTDENLYSPSCLHLHSFIPYITKVRIIISSDIPFIKLSNYLYRFRVISLKVLCLFSERCVFNNYCIWKYWNPQKLFNFRKREILYLANETVIIWFFTNTEYCEIDSVKLPYYTRFSSFPLSSFILVHSFTKNIYSTNMYMLDFHMKS